MRHTIISAKSWRRAFWLLTSGAVLGFPSAPSWSNAPSPDLLTFSQRAADLGRVAEGQERLVSFAYRNGTDTPVQIRSVRTDCACAVAEFPQAPVRPGEEGAIKILLKTEGLAGQVHKRVLVSCASGEREASVVLDIRCHVSQDGKLVPTPPSVYIGVTSGGAPFAKTVVLRTIGSGKPASILGAEPPSWVKVTFAPGKDASEWTLTVSGRAPDRPGQLVERIRLLTDSDDFPFVHVPLIGFIEGPVSAVPFGAVLLVDSEGGNRTATVRVVARDGRKIDALRVETQTSASEQPVEVTVAAGDRDSERRLVIALREGHPRDRILAWVGVAIARVEDKEYAVPVRMTFVKRSSPPSPAQKS